MGSTATDLTLVDEHQRFVSKMCSTKAIIKAVIEYLSISVLHRTS